MADGDADAPGWFEADGVGDGEDCPEQPANRIIAARRTNKVTFIIEFFINLTPFIMRLLWLFSIYGSR